MKTTRKLLAVGAGALLLANCARTSEQNESTANGGFDAPGRGGLPESEFALGDALTTGASFRGAGNMRCSMGEGRPIEYWPYIVEREGGGSAVVTVSHFDGRKRTLYFESGRASGVNVSPGAGGAFSSTRRGNLTVVRIGPESFVVPDTVLYGG